MFDRNYLGHKFEIFTAWSNNNYDYKCSVCKCKVYYNGFGDYVRLVKKNALSVYVLSCNEYIIKNIIE